MRAGIAFPGLPAAGAYNRRAERAAPYARTAADTFVPVIANSPVFSLKHRTGRAAPRTFRFTALAARAGVTVVVAISIGCKDISPAEKIPCSEAVPVLARHLTGLTAYTAAHIKMKSKLSHGDIPHNRLLSRVRSAAANGVRLLYHIYPEKT